MAWYQAIQEAFCLGWKDGSQEQRLEGLEVVIRHQETQGEQAASQWSEYWRQKAELTNREPPSWILPRLAYECAALLNGPHSE